VNIRAENVKVGSTIIKDMKEYKITDKRFHSYPRDKNNKSVTVTLTLDGFWHIAMSVDCMIDILA